MYVIATWESIALTSLLLQKYSRARTRSQTHSSQQPTTINHTPGIIERFFVRETVLQVLMVDRVEEQDTNEDAFEGVGIRDDPDVNPRTLRFEVSNLVLYKDSERNGWFEGEVVKVAQRLYGPGGVPLTQIPYIVWPQLEDAGETVWVEHDNNDYIRPRLDDLTPDPAKFHPILAHPEDPMAYLYTGLTNNPYYTEDGENVVTFIMRIEGADGAQLNPDGSISTSYAGSSVPIPQEPINGVPGDVVFRIGCQVHARRRLNTCGVGPLVDMVKIFKSIVPSESSLHELEEASRTSDEKMLQLGDALMAGVKGWERDPIRACKCYYAAAYGCQEEEEPERTGIPVGSPEAMVAIANFNKLIIKKELMGIEDLDQPVSFSRILGKCLETERGRYLSYWLMHWSSLSLKRGWVSPLILELAQAIKDMNLMNDRRFDDEFRDLVQPLLRASEYREREVEFEKLQREGRVPGGDPSDATISLFGPKANEIYHSLPASTDVVHIEYRKFPAVPFPTVVYVLVPKRKKLIKLIRLPDCFNLSPYSKESFRFVWLSIAFEFHLGTPGTDERTRPAAFSVLNSHGNREFEAFLQNEIDGSGTPIRLATHADTVTFATRRRRRVRSTLGEIVKELETQLLRVPGILTNAGSTVEDGVTGAQQALYQQYAHDILESTGNEETRILESAEHLKTEGSDLYCSSDFNGAIKFYSVSLQLLSQLVDPNNAAYKLIGTLLSNRAGCFLELESLRTSIDFRKILAQNAIKDCTLALERHWATTALPRNIQEKLRIRRDEAVARYDALNTEFESVAPILFPEAENLRAQIQETRRRNDADRESGEQTNQQTEPLVAESDEGAAKGIGTGPDALMEYGQVIYDNSLAKNAKDGCPICLGEFSGELSQIYSAVLPCGEHAMCVKCICYWKKTADKDHVDLACPLCRSLVDPEFAENLPYQIIDADQRLAMLLDKLPIDPGDRADVAHRLLWSHGFCVEGVVDILEEMLDEQAKAVFYRTEMADFSPQQKNEIYWQEMRPVKDLQETIEKLEYEKKRTYETARSNQLIEELQQLRSELAGARRHARDSIYNRLNSVGRMGAEQYSEGGEGLLQIDFHALTVRGMHEKFDELVKPILPACQRITIITGRGNHSTDGESKLKKQLIKRINDRERDIRWEAIANNPGALNVLWCPADA